MTAFVILLLRMSKPMAMVALRIEESFIQFDSSNFHSSCLDYIRNCFTYHVCIWEATEVIGSETCWAKLVDGKLPCLFSCWVYSDTNLRLWYFESLRLLSPLSHIATLQKLSSEYAPCITSGSGRDVCSVVLCNQATLIRGGIRFAQP